MTDVAGGSAPELLEGLDGDQAIADALLRAIGTPVLSPRRQAMLRARVLSAAGQSPYAIINNDPAAFRPFIPGVAIRPLRLDPVGNTQTSLWRLAAGAVIPPHDHTAEEECLVVEGSIVWDGHEYGSGDFLLARPGAHHEPFVSPNGALLMIRSEMTPFLQRVFD